MKPSILCHLCTITAYAVTLIKLKANNHFYNELSDCPMPREAIVLDHLFEKDGTLGKELNEAFQQYFAFHSLKKS